MVGLLNHTNYERRDTMWEAPPAEPEPSEPAPPDDGGDDGE